MSLHYQNHKSSNSYESENFTGVRSRLIKNIDIYMFKSAVIGLRGNRDAGTTNIIYAYLRNRFEFLTSVVYQSINLH